MSMKFRTLPMFTNSEPGGNSESEENENEHQENCECEKCQNQSDLTETENQESQQESQQEAETPQENQPSLMDQILNRVEALKTSHRKTRKQTAKALQNQRRSKTQG